MGLGVGLGAGLSVGVGWINQSAAGQQGRRAVPCHATAMHKEHTV